MLDYVIDFSDDATDFSRALTKASHAALLCRMEHGEIRVGLRLQKIDRVHRAHAQTHSTSQSSFQRTQDKNSSV